MRQRKFVVGLSALLVLGIAWYAFRPELLILNAKVSESFPQAAKSEASQPVELSRGMFHKVAHESKGAAAIYRLADGKRLLRLSNFETSNGPALHVYLVAAKDATDNATVTSAGFVDLGELKGNLGEQNYDIPADVDLAKHQAVTIWCQRFSVNFGTAPLQTR
jgi:hypothetical protein